jgi:hypothetical protein
MEIYDRDIFIEEAFNRLAVRKTNGFHLYSAARRRLEKEISYFDSTDTLYFVWLLIQFLKKCSGKMLIPDGRTNALMLLYVFDVLPFDPSGICDCLQDDVQKMPEYAGLNLPFELYFNKQTCPAEFRFQCVPEIMSAEEIYPILADLISVSQFAMMPIVRYGQRQTTRSFVVCKPDTEIGEVYKCEFLSNGIIQLADDFSKYQFKSCTMPVFLVCDHPELNLAVETDMAEQIKLWHSRRKDQSTGDLQSAWQEYDDYTGWRNSIRRSYLDVNGLVSDSWDPVLHLDDLYRLILKVAGNAETAAGLTLYYRENGTLYDSGLDVPEDLLDLLTEIGSLGDRHNLHFEADEVEKLTLKEVISSDFLIGIDV